VRIAHAWKAEIETRVSAIERGEFKLVGAADVFAEARCLVLRACE
jgi:exonuclease VII small subunit